MNINKMTAYGVSTNDWGSYISTNGKPVEHVFVTSEHGHDWGCFGGGKVYLSRPDCRVLSEGYGDTDWANRLYGTDLVLPTGIRNKIDGSCHCVANRILVLADIDVSQAYGDTLVMLFYGKYGFRLAEYIERIKQTAQEINKESPDRIHDEIVEKIASKLLSYKSDELSIIRDKFEQAIGSDFSLLNDRQKNSIRDIYQSLHENRLEKYMTLEISDGGNHDQEKYQESMIPVLHKHLCEIREALGDNLYFQIFKMAPEMGTELLTRLI